METVADQMLYSVELADTVYESSGSIHDSLEQVELVLTYEQQVTDFYSHPFQCDASVLGKSSTVSRMCLRYRRV